MARRNLIEPLIGLCVERVLCDLRYHMWTARREVVVQAGPINENRAGLAEAQNQQLTPVRPGELIGHHDGIGSRRWEQRWFRIDVPAAEPEEQGRRVLFFDCRGEHTLYIDGKAWCGIDVAHPYCPLPDDAVTCWIDTGLYHMAIWWPGKQPDQHGLRFDDAWIASRDERYAGAYYDLLVLWELACALAHRAAPAPRDPKFHLHDALEHCEPLLHRLLQEMKRACDAYAQQGIDVMRDALAGIYDQLPAEPWALDAVQIGHSHLDLVWYWPEHVGVQKGVHTASTALRLMDRYPEFRFMWTQPQSYRDIEAAEPELGGRIRAAIADGRWEATGAMWVEADNTLCCGEALSRCLTLGQRAFAELRGRICDTVWLLDVFGYSASLPQLMRLAGVRNFWTSKLGWSRVTRFPYDSFVWRSPDGSEVLTHMSLVSGSREYGPATLMRGAERYRQAGVHDKFLVWTGAGDGGGGVTEAMIERVRRMGDLARVPKARYGGVEEFFDDLEQARERLPVYTGELYLEYHRGVFTTQSEHKRLYRRAERALQTLEAARVALGGGPIDPAAWQRVCFALFHDAIPGSSIALVYEQLNPELERIGDDALRAAAGELAAGDGDWQAFNPLGLARTCVLELDDEVEPADVAQRSIDGKALAIAELPPLGSARIASAATDQERWDVSPHVLDNGRLRAEFDDAGRLVGLCCDGESVALAGPCEPRLYHDRPHRYDAWEIDQEALMLPVEGAGEIKLEIVEAGPLRAVLQGERALGDASRVMLRYVLEADASWLRIEADVDWRESHRLLKWHLPTDYRGSSARFATPTGSILRPQAPGSPADEAMWEVPASRWAAVLDDDGRGAAILAEAKYGFSCREGDLGLSLLRAPSDPDPDADVGQHRIRWAVGPHRPRMSGDELSTAAAAEALFTPPVVYRGPDVPSIFALEDGGSLLPVWALPCEEGDGWIVRLYETSGGRGRAVLHLAEPAGSVEYVDLLERPLGEASRDVAPERLGGGRYAVDYRPNQVLSIRVRPRND